MTAYKEFPEDIYMEAMGHNPLPGLAQARLEHFRRIQKNLSIHKLAALANTNHVEFLLAPCWCLSILDGLADNEAVHLLKPGSNSESQWIRRVMKEFGEGIPE